MTSTTTNGIKTTGEGYNNNNYMPPQKVSSGKKQSKNWQQGCVNYIINKGFYKNSNGRTSRHEKLINYDLLNSKYDSADLNYVTNPYGANDVGDTPARMHSLNIIRPKIDLLIGEELKRGLKYSVVGSDGEIMSAKSEARKNVIKQAIEEEINALLGEGEPDAEGKPTLNPKLQELLEDFDTNYKNIREVWVAGILKDLEYREKLELKFNDGFEHGLVSGEEIYYIGIVNKKPKVRVVNPVNFYYDKTPDLREIHKAEAAFEVRYMSKGEIIDEYGEHLSEKELSIIDEGSLNSRFGNDNYVGFAKRAVDFQENNNTYSTGISSSANHYMVYHCVWRSWEKIGFLTYLDDNGEEQQTIVDDEFKLTDEQKELGWGLDWKWRTQVWEGTKIGQDIFVNVKPTENQVDGYLPYVGRIYNAVNSESTSLVSIAKPYQYLYMIMWYRLELEVAKAKGKKMMMDMAQIPRSQGMSMDKWMYYFDNVGIGFINSFEEGTEGSSQGKTSNFNQFTSVDMTLSQSIGQYIMIINKLEEMVGSITGVSRQREGSITSSETVGGIERSVNQSNSITERWFYLHAETKIDVLTYLLEVGKLCYIDGGELSYLVDDKIRVMQKIDGAALNDSSYKLYVSGSSKDRNQMEAVRALMQMALQTDKANLSDAIKSIKAVSISEIENTIVAGEQDKLNRTAEQQNAERENQFKIEQMRIQNLKDTRDWEATQKQLDRENDIRTAEIKGLGSIGMNNPDLNANMIPDIIEQSKVSLQASKQTNEHFIKNQELQLKERELNNKKQVEDSKLEQIKEQNKSQEKIANQQFKIKEKELTLKEKIEKMKITASKNKKPS